MVLGEKPKTFWDLVTADHLICKDGSGEGDEFFDKATCAVVIYGGAVDWTACYPKATKYEADTVQAMKHFSGPLKKVKSLYADNAPELYATAKRLGWSFPSSTPGQPQSNGLAERMVRRVKEGGRACLVQSGSTREWWAYACAFFCFARNVNVVDGDSSYNSDRSLQGSEGSLRPHD